MTRSADPVKLGPPPPELLASKPVKTLRLNYGDPVRILGTIAVVIGHTADMALGVDVLTHRWWLLNYWDSFTRWAVPVYIMLSGALLLEPSRNEDGATFYRKRLSRIGVPLVFWTAFFMWFSVEYTQWVTAPDAFRLLALGKPYTHLHFIFRIAGLYFFTPMMRIWLKHTTRRMQWHAVIGLLILSSGDSMMDGITGNEPSVFARFAPFIGYYLLGYLMRDIKISPIGTAWWALGAVASCVFLAVGTGKLVGRFPNPNDPYTLSWYPSVQMILYDFLSPIRIIMAICFWLVFINVFRNPWFRSEVSRKVIAYWASTTLGLYLIHPLFREILFTGKLWIPMVMKPRQLTETFGPIFHGSVWKGVPLTAGIIYVLSLISTMILMKIPFVRRITG